MIPQRLVDFLCLAAVAFLAGCSLTTPGPVTGDVASTLGDRVFGEIAGRWEFSHRSEPAAALDHGAVPDPGALATFDRALGQTVVAIDDSGRASMVAPGREAVFRLAIEEETVVWVKLRADDDSMEKVVTYDKATGLLSVPVTFDTGDRTVVMAAFFDRPHRVPVGPASGRPPGPLLHRKAPSPDASMKARRLLGRAEPAG